ncbi:exopolysaccharide biosynthesis WecB/TagA/CpsF family protein [Rhodopseudomonas faecalis]|uniref:Exopolysaccharide biosynthesis WecB/TagA/CpsF family protein n=1 Tax=Rhodopseudomonas faecalis TaxID=99655 RepID=A0A318TX21_9BRAD|nr:WecB/TagA/CpsF family glycosyltransferase [Rhodopseudomonas faecalis]PYF04169.1 exopolysaccharide biosynthesis WecB/TagA/CpsF family protein [Rhodopseudomonas faecalis]
MADIPHAIDPTDVGAEAGDRRSGDRRKAPYQPGDTSFGPERRMQGDRRRNQIQQWPRVVLGGLPIAVVDREQSAKAMVDEALRRRGLWRYPAYLTSANGEVTYRCATNEAERELFMQADAIHADGMPHVFASRVRCEEALPERVATTDLFYDVAAEAETRGATMYMLGATEQANAAAAAKVMERFPKLQLVGRRHGFFDSPDDEIAACNEIAALSPDILWVSMGVPYEQQFVIRNRQRLTSVGVIKTSGGLFDWLTETKPRAPQWMQNLGLEWLWRIWLEPRRLGWRYLKTNPYALFLLLTRSR